MSGFSIAVGLFITREYELWRKRNIAIAIRADVKIIGVNV
jgi:hypothetical protein